MKDIREPPTAVELLLVIVLMGLGAITVLNWMGF